MMLNLPVLGVVCEPSMARAKNFKSFNNVDTRRRRALDFRSNRVFLPQNRTHSRVPSDAKEFHEVTKRDALRQLERELDNLVQTSPDDKKDGFKDEMKSFASLFNRFLQEDGPSLEWNKIEKLPQGAVHDYGSLNTPTSNDQIRAMLNKLVVVKLNGGLGTSMGCHGPKSVIPVRNDLTFLDLTVQQIEVSGSDANSANLDSICLFFLELKQDLRLERAPRAHELLQHR